MENHATAQPARRRTGWARRACRAAAFGAFLASSGLASTSCSIPANFTPTHQPVAKTSITAGELGLKAGVTKKDEAVELLRRNGVTNISTARGLDAGDDKVTIDAVTGDNMHEVLLFRNLAFHRALGIGADEGTATRMYIHLAKAEGRNAVIIVSPDIMRDESSSVIVLLDRIPPKRYFISVSMSNFQEWAGGRGMTDPMMNGHDLGGAGVTFVARGIEGWPWQYALIVKCDGKQLTITPVDMRKVLGCECLTEWFWKKEK